MLKLLRLSVALSLAASCGGMSDDASGADVLALRDSASDLAARVATYRAAAASMSSADGCRAALQQYAAHADLDVSSMRPLADRMDARLGRMGHADDADLRCGMDLMSSELSAHEAIACTSPDLAQDIAEALRHCDAMQAYAEHLQMRAAEMGSGMMGAGRSGGMADAGWMQPDGGMMPWNHPMPGCAATDGGMMADGGWMMDGGPMMDGGMHDGGMP